MVPGVGGTVHEMAMAKFTRVFAALYHGGVPMARSVTLAADASGNAHLAQKIYPAARALEQGGGITEAFVRTGAFTGPVLDMTRTGETTGKIDDMLDKVADYYESDSTTKANQLAIILGVICFLAIAAYVAYIVIKFYAGYAQNYSNV